MSFSYEEGVTSEITGGSHQSLPQVSELTFFPHLTSHDDSKVYSRVLSELLSSCVFGLVPSSDSKENIFHFGPSNQRIQLTFTNKEVHVRSGGGYEPLYEYLARRSSEALFLLDLKHLKQDELEKYILKLQTTSFNAYMQRMWCEARLRRATVNEKAMFDELFAHKRAWTTLIRALDALSHPAPKGYLSQLPDDWDEDDVKYTDNEDEAQTDARVIVKKLIRLRVHWEERERLLRQQSSQQRQRPTAASTPRNSPEKKRLEQRGSKSVFLKLISVHDTEPTAERFLDDDIDEQISALQKELKGHSVDDNRTYGDQDAWKDKWAQTDAELKQSIKEHAEAKSRIEQLEKQLAAERELTKKLSDRGQGDFASDMYNSHVDSAQYSADEELREAQEWRRQKGLLTELFTELGLPVPDDSSALDKSVHEYTEDVKVAHLPRETSSMGADYHESRRSFQPREHQQQQQLEERKYQRTEASTPHTETAPVATSEYEYEENVRPASNAAKREPISVNKWVDENADAVSSPAQASPSPHSPSTIARVTPRTVSTRELNEVAKSVRMNNNVSENSFVDGSADTPPVVAQDPVVHSNPVDAYHAQVAEIESQGAHFERTATEIRMKRGVVDSFAAQPQQENGNLSQEPPNQVKSGKGRFGPVARDVRVKKNVVDGFAMNHQRETANQNQRYDYLPKSPGARSGRVESDVRVTHTAADGFAAPGEQETGYLTQEPHNQVKSGKGRFGPVARDVRVKKNVVDGFSAHHQRESVGPQAYQPHFTTPPSSQSRTRVTTGDSQKIAANQNSEERSTATSPYQQQRKQQGKAVGPSRARKSSRSRSPHSARKSSRSHSPYTAWTPVLDAPNVQSAKHDAAMAQELERKHEEEERQHEARLERIAQLEADKERRRGPYKVLTPPPRTPPIKGPSFMPLDKSRSARPRMITKSNGLSAFIVGEYN